MPLNVKETFETLNSDSSLQCGIVMLLFPFVYRIGRHKINPFSDRNLHAIKM